MRPLLPQLTSTTVTGGIDEPHTPPSYPDHVHSPRVDTSFSQPALNTAQHRRPFHAYLGLRARLLLSILSPALVAILFTGTHLLLSSGDIDEKVSAAKDKLLAACHDAERQASYAASLPRYMAESMNERTKEAVEGTVQGLGRVLYLSLVALEALITFVVDSYRSVFLCFMELLVRGSLSLLMAAVDLMNTAVKDAGQGIKAAVQTSVDGVNTFLSGSLAGINDILAVVGKSVKVPQIAQPDLAALDNVRMPTSLQDSLQRLNSTLPTLTELKKKMDAIIQGPFEELKTDVNKTVAGFTFDTSLMPLPQQQTIQFCDDIDVSPLDRLSQKLKHSVTILVILLAVAAVLLALFNLARGYWAWRCFNRNLERTRAVWLEDQFEEERKSPSRPNVERFLQKDNLYSLVAMSQHPLATTVAIRGARKLGIRTKSGRAKIQWLACLLCHPMAVVILVTGLVGLLSIQVQIFAAREVAHRFQGELDDAFQSFGETALARVNLLTAEASRDYADKSNAVISTAQSGINDHMFGWLNTTISVLNGTLNEFVDGITMALNDTFSDTPLYTPLQTFVSCLLLQKVTNIEKALTWLHDNAHVELDPIAPTVLMLSANRTQELMQPVMDAASGGDGSARGGVLTDLVESYERKLKKERVLFAILLALYGLVAVVGIAAVLLHKGRVSTEADRDVDHGIRTNVTSPSEKDAAPDLCPEKSFSTEAFGTRIGSSADDGTTHSARMAQAQRPPLGSSCAIDSAALEDSATPMYTFERMLQAQRERHSAAFTAQPSTRRHQQPGWTASPPVNGDGATEVLRPSSAGGQSHHLGCF